MGGSNSKQKVLTEYLTSIVMDVLTQVSSSSTGGIVQKQGIIVTGSGNKLSSINLSAAAKIAITMLQDASVNLATQATLLNKVVTALEQKTTDFPEISAKKTEQEIQNLVRNVISMNMSTQAIQSMSLSILQEQSLAVSGTGQNVTDINLALSANAIGALSQTIASSIVSGLDIGNDASSGAKNTTTNFVSSIIESVGNMLGSVLDGLNSILSLSTGTILMLIILGLAGAYASYVIYNEYYADKNKNKADA